MAKQRTDTQAVIKLVIDGKQSEASLKELNDTARKLRTEFLNMKEAADPAAYKKTRDELKRVNDAIKDVTDSLKNGTDESNSFKKAFGDITSGVFGGNMLTRAWDLAAKGITGFITKNAELSDEMAGVQKTTGLSEQAVDRLNDKFKSFNTRTAKSELLGLAQVAGKLGISAEKDVEGFVRAADKIGVALGEDLGGTEEALNSIGKLLDIFRVTDDFGLEDSILKVGSAINDLGASGTANERYLVDFTQRMAGIAPAAKVSITDVLGLGGTLDELGQSAEASSTAVGQFIVGMGKDIPKYAKIAGMSVADFSKLLKEDANEAFIRVLESSKSAGGGIQALATNMGLIGVAGARGVAALGVLADNTDKLREKQTLAAQSFADGTSIINEFNTANNNLAANLEKIQNRLASLWENSKLRQFFTDLTASILGTNSEAEKLTRSYVEQKSAINDLERNTFPLIARYDQLKFQGKLNKEEQEELHNIIQQLAKIIPGAVTEWNKYGEAMDINRDKVSKFTTAQRELFLVRNQDAIKGLQKLFNTSIKDAEIYQKRLNAIINKQGTDYFGEGDITRFTEQATLSMGEAYDAVKKLRDEFGVKLTTAQQEVIDHFEKQTKATKGNKDENNANNASVTKTVETLETLREKLKSLKEDREKAPIGSPQLAALNKDIVATEARINAIEASFTKSRSKTKADDSEAKKATEQYKKLLQEYGELDAKRLLDTLSKNEKEKGELEKTYSDEINKYKDFLSQKGVTDAQAADVKQKIQDLEAKRDEAVRQLGIRQEKEYAQVVSDLRTGLANKYETERQKEINRINQFYNKRKEEAKGNAEAEKQIEEDRAKDLADAEIREKKRLKDYTEAVQKETELIGTDYRTKRLQDLDIQYQREVDALKEKYSKELEDSEEFQEALKALEDKYKAKKQEEEDDHLKQQKSAEIEAAQALTDAIFDIRKNNRDAELNEKLSELEKQRETELSNTNLTEAQKKQINAKYDALEKAEKKKAWKADKMDSLTRVAIQTALNIVKAFPNPIQMALAGALGVAQAAVIAAQKPPQYAKGGLLPAGPSHASGGLRLINSQNGQDVAELEGGEPILSRRTYQNNPEIVDKLLYSSMRQNGARIQVDPSLVSSSVVSGRSGGTSVQSAPVVNVSTPAPDLSSLVSAMDRMSDAFNKAQSKEVVLSYRRFEEEQAKVVKIRNEVNA